MFKPVLRILWCYEVVLLEVPLVIIRINIFFRKLNMNLNSKDIHKNVLMAVLLDQSLLIVQVEFKWNAIYDLIGHF